MKDIKTGGPAFPVALNPGEGFDASAMGPADGMTLRDYFAAKAMQGMVSTDMPERALALGVSHLENEQALAQQAYAYADAMLAAREGGAK